MSRLDERVATLPGLFTPDECAHMIDIGPDGGGVIPSDADGWRGYLDQLTTAMRDANDGAWRRALDGGMDVEFCEYQPGDPARDYASDGRYTLTGLLPLAPLSARVGGDVYFVPDCGCGTLRKPGTPMIFPSERPYKVTAVTEGIHYMLAVRLTGLPLR